MQAFPYTHTRVTIATELYRTNLVADLSTASCGNVLSWFNIEQTTPLSNQMIESMVYFLSKRLI